MAYYDRSLPDHSPKLGLDEFAIREKARSFEIDLDGRRATWQFAGETEQLVLDTRVEGWTPEEPVLWLDRQVRQPDISQGDLLKSPATRRRSGCLPPRTGSTRTLSRG